MKRLVAPEWLDGLPAADPRALGSRRDLRRLNGWMRNALILSGALVSCFNGARPVRLVELGSGDGDLLARVARRLGAGWQGTQATLLDRQNHVSAHAARTFRELGWEIEIAQRDVFEWCRETHVKRFGMAVTNLFLHHFDGKSLPELLREIARRTSFFIALEPRRSLLALAFSRLVGLIGCNAVTRHDAPASVHAGFLGNELSQLWPSTGDWLICERRAGPFGHLFIARSLTRA